MSEEAVAAWSPPRRTRPLCTPPGHAPPHESARSHGNAPPHGSVPPHGSAAILRSVPARRGAPAAAPPGAAAGARHPPHRVGVAGRGVSRFELPAAALTATVLGTLDT